MPSRQRSLAARRAPTPAARRVCVATAFAREAEVIPEPDRPWRRLLRLDGEDSSHVDLRDPRALDFAYVRVLADICDLIAPAAAPLRVLHLGGGGFTLPRYVAATRPSSRQVVAEHDGPLVDLARAELGLRTSAQLRVKIGDARDVLDGRPPGSSDLVVLDAFAGIEVPPRLADAGFVAAAARALAGGGVLAANVIDAAPAHALAARLAAGFTHRALLAPRKVMRGRVGGNVIVLAARDPLPLRALRTRAQRSGVPMLLQRLGANEPGAPG